MRVAGGEGYEAISVRIGRYVRPGQDQKKISRNGVIFIARPVSGCTWLGPPQKIWGTIGFPANQAISVRIGRYVRPGQNQRKIPRNGVIFIARAVSGYTWSGPPKKIWGTIGFPANHLPQTFQVENTFNMLPILRFGFYLNFSKFFQNLFKNFWKFAQNFVKI